MKKSLIKNEQAILDPILTCILSLAIVVIMYFMFSPMLNYISNVMISMGAPAGTSMFYVKCFNWGMILFSLGAIITLIANIYKKTHDSSYKQQWN